MVASVVGPDGLWNAPSDGALRHAGSRNTAVHRPPLVPLLGLLTLCLIWGLSVPVTKLGLQVLPPVLLAALRYLAAAPFFVLSVIGVPPVTPRLAGHRHRLRSPGRLKTPVSSISTGLRAVQHCGCS
jgi:hypothetical protein